MKSLSMSVWSARVPCRSKASVTTSGSKTQQIDSNCHSALFSMTFWTRKLPKVLQLTSISRGKSRVTSASMKALSFVFSISLWIVRQPTWSKQYCSKFSIISASLLRKLNSVILGWLAKGLNSCESFLKGPVSKDCHSDLPWLEPLSERNDWLLYAEFKRSVCFWTILDLGLLSPVIHGELNSVEPDSRSTQGNSRQPRLL